jgi:hypothetical protein
MALPVGIEKLSSCTATKSLFATSPAMLTSRLAGSKT